MKILSALAKRKMAPTFFSCDWGTTHFRLRLVERKSLRVLAERKTGDGVASLYGRGKKAWRKHYPEILGKYLDELEEEAGRLADYGVVSGMASSRIGWRELPYAELPQPLNGGKLTCATFKVRGVQTLLVSGLRDKEDVLRGEEIEAVGLGVLVEPIRNAEDALLILPGTHSKHVHLRKGEITQFETHMTGELFDRLQGSPTLAPCLAKAAFKGTNAGYFRGVKEAAQKGLSAGLFKIRAGQVLGLTSGEDNFAYLSGLLIGGELAGLTKIRNQLIFVAAQGPLRGLYQAAFKVLGLKGKILSERIVRKAVPAGHRAMLEFFQ